MPIIKSAKKRVRTAKTKHSVNQLQRVGSKTAVRLATISIGSQNGDAGKLATIATSKLDRAAQKGVIHKNKAARLKSRLAAKLKLAGIQLSQTAAKPAKPTKKKTVSKK